MARSQAHYVADTRRTLKDRDAEWLRTYINHHVLRIVMADEELAKLNEARLLSPALSKALATLIT